MNNPFAAIGAYIKGDVDRISARAGFNPLTSPSAAAVPISTFLGNEVVKPIVTITGNLAKDAIGAVADPFVKDLSTTAKTALVIGAVGIGGYFLIRTMK